MANARHSADLATLSRYFPASFAMSCDILFQHGLVPLLAAEVKRAKSCNLQATGHERLATDQRSTCDPCLRCGKCVGVKEVGATYGGVTAVRRLAGAFFIAAGLLRSRRGFGCQAAR